MKLVSQSMVFQPIVFHSSSKAPAIVSYEALWKPEHNTPAEAFRIQRQNGTLTWSDLSCMNSAWMHRPTLVGGAKLHLNVFPETLETAEFWDWIDRLPPNPPVVWELLELPWAANTLDRLKQLRTLGFTIAFDDIGQTSRTWQALRHFTPDIIKLDARVTKPTRRNEHALRSVMLYAKDRGVLLIAEAVETSEQASWLQELGIYHFQGYLYARPQEEPASLGALI